MMFSQNDPADTQSGNRRTLLRKLVGVRKHSRTVGWSLAAACAIVLALVGYKISEDHSRPVTAAELPPPVTAPVAPRESTPGGKSTPDATTANPESALRIQILSGKTGRPIVGAHLLLQREDGLALTGSRSNPELVTDLEGYAPIPDTTSAKTVHALVRQYQPCSHRGTTTFSMQTIRTPGVVSENSCKPRITLYKQPGTLVYFVRPESLLEKISK